MEPSYISPNLAAGSYTITLKQTIEAGEKKLCKERAATSKMFHVKAPQYSLPEGAVHSIYPPSGSKARPEVLPHVLFTDPYLPWERVSIDTGDDRSRTPWLALLVFNQEELELTPDLLTGGGSLFEETTLASKTIRPSPTCAVDIPLSEVHRISRSFYPAPKPDDSSASGRFIFVKKNLFQLLTTQHDVHGTANANQEFADVSRYQGLAHVRHPKARGMEVTDTVEDPFGVVLSHRVAAFDAQKPTRAIVHLVSIEAWNTVNRKTLADNPSIEYVLLSTLHSWSYTALPSNTPSVNESFQQLGRSCNVLRAPDKTLEQAVKNTTKLGQHIKKRLEDGYTMTRFRTQTGEETVAFHRGALIPTTIPKKVGDFWTSLSFNGGDLQRFDEEAGLMDITYSSAWLLGKALAIADASFTAALSRLRSLTEVSAMDKAKQKGLLKREEWKSRDELIKSLGSSLAARFKLASGEQAMPATESVPEQQAASERISQFAASDPRGEKFFNKLSGPNSTDWMIVLSWVLDRMFLFGIPAQYLLTDPSYVPDESLRFFHIDPHWIDALIDGALSIANHINQDDDTFRRILKGAFNKYFVTIDPETGYRPQIPTYGCFVRSGLVKDFPDMHIVAPFVEKETSSLSDEDKKSRERAPILRQERLAEDLLLCLFDRVPGKEELPTLAFTQPVHQQYFMVGDQITDQKLVTAYKKTYTVAPAGGTYSYDDFPHKEFTRPRKDDPPPSGNCIFIWGDDNEARFLNMPGLRQDILDTLQADSGTFDDTILNAAVVGHQLSSRTYRFKLFSEYPTPPPNSQQPHVAALQAFSAADSNEGPRQFRRLNKPANQKQDTTNSAASNMANIHTFEPIQLLVAPIDPMLGFPRR